MKNIIRIKPIISVCSKFILNSAVNSVRVIMSDYNLYLYVLIIYTGVLGIKTLKYKNESGNFRMPGFLFHFLNTPVVIYPVQELSINVKLNEHLIMRFSKNYIMEKSLHIFIQETFCW